MALDDRGGVRHMVEVPVGEQQQVDSLVRKGLVSTHWGVEKDESFGCFVVKRVGIERSARKHFEPIHG